MRNLFTMVVVMAIPTVAQAQLIPRIFGRAAVDLSRPAQSTDDFVVDEWTNKDSAFPTSEDEAPVSRFKKRALQRVDVSGGWLRSTGGDINSAYLRTSFAVGMPIKGDLDNVVGVIPSFRVDFLDAQPQFDVPEELFETGVAFLWRRKINDRWSFLGQVQPSIRSDFTTGDNAVRIFGMALWTCQYVPDKLSVTVGAVVLGRNDLPALPAIGFNWTPDARTKVEIGLPRSRFAKRIAKDGAQSETWSYVSGAIGGNTWAVTRQSGLTDELSLRDLRAMVGIEHIMDGGGGCFAEAGYSFFRKIEYESTETEIELSDGFVVQAGWAW